jgi:hypothetical protein
MFRDSFVGKTGQSWKIVTGFLGMWLGLFGLFGSLWMDDIGREMVNVAVFFLAAAIVSCFYGIFGPRCPRCRSRPVWKAVSEQGVGSWLHCLIQLRQCPACNYRPEDTLDVGVESKTTRP